MNLDKNTIKKLRGLIFFAVVVFLGILRFDVVWNVITFIFSLIFPFVLGACIAFIVNVPMSFAEKKLFKEKAYRPKGNRRHQESVRKLISMIKRPISLVLTLVFIISILLVVTFLVLPELGNTFATLSKEIPVYLDKSVEFLQKTFVDYPHIFESLNEMEFDWKEISTTAMGYLQNGLLSTVNAAVNIVGALTNFFIAFIFAIYILLQKERLSRQITIVLHAFLSDVRVKKVLAISHLTYTTFSNFLSGQCIEAVILGTLFFISMSLLRFPYALLVGVLISFTALIPIFGAFIGCAVGAFLIFMVSPIQALYFLILFLVLQQLEGNLIYPYVVGNSVGLPSIWVLVAVTLGGSTMGIVGMLIFIPIASVMYALFRELVYKRLKNKEI